MRKFVAVAGQDCTIILFNGNDDYYDALSDLKELHNVSIHLIRLANSCSLKLDQISDYTFMVNNGVLESIKSTGVPMYFISIKNNPLTMAINFVMDTLNNQIAESIQKSAILFDDSICIGFPTLWNAEKAIEQLNGSQFHGHFLKAELLLDSPLTEILKCVEPNTAMEVKSNKEVEQLTFIKMRNYNEADNSKIIKFCITCTEQSGSQCIWAYQLQYEPTKWELLYNLFEKLYDLGAKKVMFDGNLYCAHFDSVSAYHAFTEKRSRYFKPLEPINAEDLNEKFTKNMNRYVHEIPWCLNSELDIHCLVVKVNDQIHIEFKEMCKKILGYRECIFIKPVLDEFWIGFPDELSCESSKKIVLKFLADLKYLNDVSMAKPSNELLESVNLHDLAGDAYDLAFLSAQLESTKPIAKPQIIERISYLRTEEQECNAAVFHITIKCNFRDWPSWVKLSLEQIVKILVHFSKVIPLAATASYDEATLIFNTWYEAFAAHHFIKNLTLAAFPYFRTYNGASEVQKQQLPCAEIFEYYIINDKRKVLDKIIQNKSLVDRLHLNSSTNKSTPNIDLLDGEITKKIQYLFVITTNSESQFTSGMVSIIKMNLVEMDCPVCIEFDDKIWVGVEYLKKGNKAKTRIDQIKFKMLHENDEDDFNVSVVMDSTQESPPKVTEMLANKLLNPKKSSINMKAVGMSTSRYWQLVSSPLNAINESPALAKAFGWINPTDPPSWNVYASPSALDLEDAELTFTILYPYRNYIDSIYGGLMKYATKALDKQLQNMFKLKNIELENCFCN
uniref:Uncharacterized protein n=1 Tax=Tetranychus urticae TaxID=32264 RepID=T1KGH8_TETUR